MGTGHLQHRIGGGINGFPEHQPATEADRYIEAPAGFDQVANEQRPQAGSLEANQGMLIGVSQGKTSRGRRVVIELVP